MIVNGSWIDSAKDYEFIDGILYTNLKNKDGKWISNKLKINLDSSYYNDNGILREYVHNNNNEFTLKKSDIINQKANKKQKNIYDNSYFYWTYTNRINYIEDPREQNFIKAIKNIGLSNNINVCYLIEGFIYIVDHLIPLFHVFPGPMVCLNIEENIVAQYLINRKGFSKALFIEADKNVLKKYLNQSPTNLVVSCSGNALSELRQEDHPNYVVLTHGIDEDYVYRKKIQLDELPIPEKWISLVFSKFNRSFIHDNRLNNIDLDPKKKTIMFSGTIGLPGDFLNVGKTPKKIWKKLLNELDQCTKKYNVIVRPHPKLKEKSIKEIEKKHNIILIKPLDYPFYLPFVHKVDVIIGPPTGVLCGSTYYSEKPLIVLRPDVSWNGSDNAKTSKMNGSLMLSPATCIFVNEHTYMDTSLMNLVEKALENNLENKQRIVARKNYFKYWFGNIDGYEDYKTWIKILKQYLKINTAELEALYNQFPK